MPLKVTSTPYVFNPVASNIPKWWAFELLRWMKTCTSQRGTMKFCVLTDLRGTKIYKFVFVKYIKNTNVEDG
jgi:hypothetical protein